METKDLSNEILDHQKTETFATAEELVSMRKPKELIQPSIGTKYSARSESWIEKKAVECALESYEESLSQKRGARISDLIKAVWNAELGVATVPKLKGKFVQHMGQMVNGEINLRPEESLFLLENGCIEVWNAEKPMSTEEAYNVMLKGYLSTEKYQVYSHLSQLGYIVVPHQKDLKKKHQVKVTQPVSSENKKRKSSPEPDEHSAKRLTFQGAFSEENDNSAARSSEICDTSPDNQSTEIDNAVPPMEGEFATDKQESKEEEPASEEMLDVETIDEPCNDDTQEVVKPATPENQNELKESETLAEEPMEAESPVSEEVQLQMCEESEDVVEVVKEDNIDDSQCAMISSSVEVTTTKEDSDCLSLSCSSDSDLYKDENDTWSNNAWGGRKEDEEVTLLEVTKKETTPLAVIDLLSEDEGNAANNDDSGSDDEIKIIEVCLKPQGNADAEVMPLNLEKIKSNKSENCKAEVVGSSSVDSSNHTPLVTFPYLFRKDNICVARPPLSTLPFYVNPKKEVYILDLAKRRNSSFDNTSQQRQQPRVWNSFRDMQNYQRSRRQNRHSNRTPRYQEQPWRGRVMNHREGNFPRDYLQTAERNDYGQGLLPHPSRYDRHRNSPHTNSNNHNASNNLHDASNSVQDQKPFGRTEPRMYGNGSHESSAFPDTTLNTLPPFPGNFGSLLRPPMNLGFENQSLHITSSHFSQNPLFIAEVHRTAYSYASSVLQTMFGSTVNMHMQPPPPLLNNFPLPPLNNGLNLNTHMTPNGEDYSMQNSRQQTYGDRRPYRNQSFPCQYRNANNKRSWDDVTASVEEEQKSDTSDIEEIPININEFLWNVSSICPLVKPGIKHAIPNIIKDIQLTQMARITSRNNANTRCLPSTPSLEITFDVYMPGTHFKKSCPGKPRHRVVVVRALDPIPRFSEIAVLQRKWSDGADLQLAVVNNTEISFCSFSSVSLPDSFPTAEEALTLR